jgi:hypothetical protein
VNLSQGTGRVKWREHVIEVRYENQPYPAAPVKGCLDPALLPGEIKADVRRHRSNITLEYAGAATTALEQHVALAAVSAVLAEFGAMVVMNEDARAMILVEELLPESPGEDMMAVLRSLPLPYLYAGFVKMELTDVPGVWMRTFAANKFSLPNLARHATHDEGSRTFKLFTAVLGYLAESKMPLEVGEQLKIDNDMWAVREPLDAEWWLESEGRIWVLERS